METATKEVEKEVPPFDFVVNETGNDNWSWAYKTDHPTHGVVAFRKDQILSVHGQRPDGSIVVLYPPDGIS
jgi:hypothetical protein